MLDNLKILFDALIQLNSYIKHKDACISSSAFYKIKNLLICKVLKDINNGVYDGLNIGYEITGIQKQQINKSWLSLVSFVLNIDGVQYNFHQKLNAHLINVLKPDDLTNIQVCEYVNQHKLHENIDHVLYKNIWSDLLYKIARLDWFILDCMDDNAAISFLNDKYENIRIKLHGSKVSVFKYSRGTVLVKYYELSTFKKNVYTILHIGFQF